MLPIRELTAPAKFDQPAFLEAGEPVVLRGLVGHWPAVTHGRSSTQALARYLQGFASADPVDAVMTAPEHEGRLFYDEALQGFNFLRNRLALSEVLDQVLRYAALPTAPAVAVQSAPIPRCAPGFEHENRVDGLDAAIVPRLWLGNAITTPTHLDEWCNLACVAAGRRRFTLFPPEQIANLYIGPLDFAPTGAPVSLVRLHAPDLERYPRFAQALEAARSVELQAGDALYLPPLWWHHVQSLERFNVLVNYWWHADGAPQGASASGFDALLHALLAIRHLPAPVRGAWEALFQQYVFGDPARAVGHLPEFRHGILGRLSADRRAAVLREMARRLAGPTD